VRSISKRILSTVGGTALAAAALVATTGAPAVAEPATTPAASDIVVAGSDTIQALYDQFQADRPGLQSWDATGFSPITPKAGCAQVTRPNGSGAGIAAIGGNATTTDGRTYCVNVARSSRTPASTDPAGLSWLPLATDAVSWSAVSAGNAPANLTSAQLYHIFRCDAGWTKWNDTNIGGASAATIRPVLPQTASGTRSFFLSALNASQGLSGSLTPGPCVDVVTQPEENEGTNALFAAGNANAVNILFPYSAAVYAAQSANGRGTGGQGSLTIRQIDGTDPLTTDGTYKVANRAFAASFQRIVFNVVRTVSLGHPTPTMDGDVNALVTWECTNPTAQQDVRSFGFGLPPAGFCGAALYTT
jgi:ABC-type phosphate transport system substrate-binding protein